jgi:general secretion pathway protein F
VPNFRYRALSQAGEVVSGYIVAPTAAEVSQRIEYLGLLPIEAVTEQKNGGRRTFASLFNRPTALDVTLFTRDLALLLRAGARINGALEVLSSDAEVGRLGFVISGIKSAILSGETFADAIRRYPQVFPPTYVALVSVGELTNTLDNVLDVIANERMRAEVVRQRLSEAVRYPLFILCAATAVLSFFLLFVLPQFASVIHDFGAQLDPLVATLLDASSFVKNNSDFVALILLVVIVTMWLVLRRPNIRLSLFRQISRLPILRGILSAHRTALFCRNLGVLLGNGISLPETLRILEDMMASTSSRVAWASTADRVRHGSKLSDALAATNALPPIAVRMLRLGDETGQLPMLAARVADFYEAKLQRTLDRLVGIAGPAAIIIISVVVGGLIVSVMTALLSITQMVN